MEWNGVATCIENMANEVAEVEEIVNSIIGKQWWNEQDQIIAKID